MPVVFASAAPVGIPVSGSTSAPSALSIAAKVQIDFDVDNYADIKSPAWPQQPRSIAAPSAAASASNPFSARIATS